MVFPNMMFTLVTNWATWITHNESFFLRGLQKDLNQRLDVNKPPPLNIVYRDVMEFQCSTVDFFFI